MEEGSELPFHMVEESDLSSCRIARSSQIPVLLKKTISVEIIITLAAYSLRRRPMTVASSIE